MKRRAANFLEFGIIISEEIREVSPGAEGRLGTSLGNPQKVTIIWVYR